jgi:spore germination protein KB
MEIEGKLSHSLTALLVYGSSMGTIIYTFTEVTTVTGKPFWIAILIGVLAIIPFALWILILGSYKKGGTLFDILEDGIGKFFTKILLLLYILLNIAVSASMLNLSAGSIKVFFLPRTPLYIIIFFIVLMSTIFANSGFKNCSRLIAMLCVLATINYFIGFSISFFNNFEIEFLKPIFDTSGSQLLKGVLFTTENDAECLLFLMIAVDSIPQTKKHYLAIFKGLLFWSLILSIATLIMEGIIGQDMLSRVAAAGVAVASDIRLGSFLSGLEIFIMITYQLIAILKTTIFIYCCFTASKKLFNVPRGKPLLILSALAVFAASSWLNSYNIGYFFSIFLGNYIIPAFVLFILLLCTISVFIKRRREGKNANEN